jgi:hypothetical protein
VISNKINTNHTYLATTNYWAPLHEAEEDANVKEIKQIKAVQPIANTKSNKWTRWIERRWRMKLVIYSRATSNFVREEMNLPKKGKSNKEVFLPDNTKLQVSYKTKLPFEQLSNKAREADILPGLNTPLVSINKMAEEGYNTVFHPGEEEVTVHKKGTITIAMTEPPILQGCKSKGAKLWAISAGNETKKEQANNAYNLSLISQTVE